MLQASMILNYLIGHAAASKFWRLRFLQAVAHSRGRNKHGA